MTRWIPIFSGTCTLQQLQQEGIGPLVDHISFASVKKPWTPYSWLAELGMKWIWDHATWRADRDAGDSRSGVRAADRALLSPAAATKSIATRAAHADHPRHGAGGDAGDAILELSAGAYRDRSSCGLCVSPAAPSQAWGAHGLSGLFPRSARPHQSAYLRHLRSDVDRRCSPARGSKKIAANSTLCDYVCISILGCCCTPMLGGTISAIANT